MLQLFFPTPRSLVTSSAARGVNTSGFEGGPGYFENEDGGAPQLCDRSAAVHRPQWSGHLLLLEAAGFELQ
jgi:hypothetical protein